MKPSADWDIMILHYLGVDHIGHLGGPRSTLMPQKLSEMDNIIQRIAKYLVNYCFIILYKVLFVLKFKKIFN